MVKSATGNTLFGHKMFNSKPQAGGVTTKCELYRAAIQDGPIINVIDTPVMCSDPLKYWLKLNIVNTTSHVLQV